MVFLIGYQNFFFTVFSGIANGCMIEGGAVYAYDPVFKQKNYHELKNLKVKVIPEIKFDGPSEEP